MSEAPYRLVLTPPAIRAVRSAVPEAVAAAVVEFLTGALIENPHRVGKQLRGDLAGIHSARRGTYRVLHRINEVEHDVVILRILGVHLSQDANDTACFAPTLQVALAAGTGLNRQIGTVLADAGYFTGENLTMPGPNRLIAPGKNRDVLHDATTEPTSGPPPENADAFDTMRHRLKIPENATTYKRRSATVETVIAHLKDQTGLRRFSRRGIQAVTAELHLAAAVVNLRRLHTATPTA